MAITTPFQTLFAVPLTCTSCVTDISSALSALQGIQKVEANLKEQLVTVEGTAPPSAIVATIQATGRDAILRGSGVADGAAVCILETHGPSRPTQVRGLARMVQVAEDMTVIDLTLRGLVEGEYVVTVRQRGDISSGVVSLGGIWGEEEAKGGVTEKRGELGSVVVGRDGAGSVFLEKRVAIWEMIGRGMIVERRRADESEREDERHDESTMVGVIARSAGVWDNEKTVCSCSGKTLWEEREDEVRKGML